VVIGSHALVRVPLKKIKNEPLPDFTELHKQLGNMKAEYPAKFASNSGSVDTLSNDMNAQY
ncbi:hypothetical protein L9G16_20915, partial [Shewanella sp. A25]|nr:hypothetical protein [Shewanella shenzhenensis]